MDFDIEKILDDRKRGMSLRKLGEKYDKSASTIKKYLNINGVNTSYKIVTDNKLIVLYKSGKTCKEVAKIIGGISYQSVYGRLKKLDKIRSISVAARNKSINHMFFSTFTPTSCYWAGFLAADGCVRKTRLSINLAKIDKDHLEKLKKAIGFVKLLKQYKNSYYFGFGSREIITDLKNNFNIIPKKSLILEPPKQIPEEYIPHFIRGYIDGDGSYFYSGYSFGIEIAGTKNMLSWIKENFNQNCKIGNPSIIKKKNIYVLRFVGNRQVPKIIRWLYQNHTINTILDRKYDKVKKFI